MGCSKIGSQVTGGRLALRRRSKNKRRVQAEGGSEDGGRRQSPSSTKAALFIRRSCWLTDHRLRSATSQPQVSHRTPRRPFSEKVAKSGSVLLRMGQFFFFSASSTCPLFAEYRSLGEAYGTTLKCGNIVYFRSSCTWTARVCRVLKMVVLSKVHRRANWACYQKSSRLQLQIARYRVSQKLQIITSY